MTWGPRTAALGSPAWKSQGRGPRGWQRHGLTQAAPGSHPAWDFGCDLISLSLSSQFCVLEENKIPAYNLFSEIPSQNDLLAKRELGFSVVSYVTHVSLQGVAQTPLGVLQYPVCAHQHLSKT